MLLSELKLAKLRVVGTNEALKAVKGGRALKIFVARDANKDVVEPLYKLCRKEKIPIVEVDSMRELGAACGIKIKAAAAAIIS